MAEIVAIDFFASSGRVSAESALQTLERRLLRQEERSEAAGDALRKSDHQGRTWVTRKNIHVDRIASAWLIRRFIDPRATFKFVAGQGYQARDRELTFDMYEATFTHVGDACTFETLMQRFGLKEPGLAPIAEIVHDIDVKDGKFARAEAPGIATLVAAIAASHRDDDARIAVATPVFDALFELFGHRKTRGGIP
jgi:hypothetical protein